MIKRTWLTEAGRDLFTISIRQNAMEIEMVHNKTLLPPNESIDGKRLSLEEAIFHNVVEQHHTLGVFTIEDLIALRTAIDEVIYE